jgi:hypothetical protein
LKVSELVKVCELKLSFETVKPSYFSFVCTKRKVTKEKAATPKTNPVYQHFDLIRVDFGFVHAGVACLPDRQASQPANLLKSYSVVNASENVLGIFLNNFRISFKIFQYFPD